MIKILNKESVGYKIIDFLGNSGHQKKTTRKMTETTKCSYVSVLKNIHILIKCGLVEEFWEDKQTRYFSLTKKGRKIGEILKDCEIKLECSPRSCCA